MDGAPVPGHLSGRLRGGVYRKRRWRHWLKLGATAVAAVVVAEGAAWLLAPRDVIEPVAVDPVRLLRPPSRSTRRATTAPASACCSSAALVAQAGGARRCWSPGARAGLGSCSSAPASARCSGGAAAAGGPRRWRSRSSRSRSTSPRTSARSTSASPPRTSAPGRATGRSRTRSAPCSRARSGPGALALIRRSPRNWWIPGSAAVVAIGGGLHLAGARSCWRRSSTTSSRCERGRGALRRARARRRAPASTSARSTASTRAGAARRSTPTSAGSGRPSASSSTTTCSTTSSRGERRSVVAHELAHVSENDIPRGILFVAIAAPLARPVHRTRLRGAGPPHRRRAGPRPRPARAGDRAVAVTSFVIGVAGNQLSRAVEAQGRHRAPSS